jgi:hypothetical protein
MGNIVKVLNSVLSMLNRGNCLGLRKRDKGDTLHDYNKLVSILLPDWFL